MNETSTRAFSLACLNRELHAQHCGVVLQVAFSILRGNQLERYEWAAMERETISRQFKALDDVSQKIKVGLTALYFLQCLHMALRCNLFDHSSR